MGFSRQESWSGLPFPSPGDLPDPGIEPQVSCISKRIFYPWITWEALLTAVASFSLSTCTTEEESLSHDSLLLQLLQGIMKADFKNFYFFSFDAHQFFLYMLSFFISYHYPVFFPQFFQHCFFFLSFFLSIFYHIIAHLFLVFFMLPFLTHMSPLKRNFFFLWFYSILFWVVIAQC